MNDRSEGPLEAAKQEYAANGIDCYTVVFDVTDEDAVDAGHLED